MGRSYARGKLLCEVLMQGVRGGCSGMRVQRRDWGSIHRHLRLRLARDGRGRGPAWLWASQRAREGALVAF